MKDVTNSKYQYSPDCAEISGFGGRYETACRTMVIAGMEWLEEHKSADPQASEHENVFGLLFDENKDMEALQSAMNEAIGNGASGAMMHACTHHVMLAKRVGWEEYIRMGEERQSKKLAEAVVDQVLKNEKD